MFYMDEFIKDAIGDYAEEFDIEAIVDDLLEATDWDVVHYVRDRGYELTDAAGEIFWDVVAKHDLKA